LPRHQHSAVDWDDPQRLTPRERERVRVREAVWKRKGEGLTKEVGWVDEAIAIKEERKEESLVSLHRLSLAKTSKNHPVLSDDKS